jgi:serine/threonine-protein phosphatase 2A regulatory subunit B''
MENFIFELIPRLPQLNTLQEEFYPFYVFTAVRKFFFFLDPKRTGRIRINDLLQSTILPELYEQRQEQPLGASETASNWFSMQSALKVYGAYLELDVDLNGMLSKNELSRFGSGMLTDVFIDRVFDEIQTYRDAETGEREMDYKAFLDFVLAMENKSSRQAIQYFWKLIDIHQTGIDGFVINYFFRAVVRLLQTRQFDVASVDDVKDEIFDMVRQDKKGVITLEDLINCRQGGTVLSMLVDAAAFQRYDNRENLMDDDEDNLL